MPAAAAADWTHLAHHFARFGVLNEVSMPQMVYMLVGCFLWGSTCSGTTDMHLLHLRKGE